MNKLILILTLALAGGVCPMAGAIAGTERLTTDTDQKIGVLLSE